MKHFSNKIITGCVVFLLALSAFSQSKTVHAEEVTGKVKGNEIAAGAFVLICFPHKATKNAKEHEGENSFFYFQSLISVLRTEITAT